jgi:hypothetical protein
LAILTVCKDIWEIHQSKLTDIMSWLYSTYTVQYVTVLIYVYCMFEYLGRT